LEGLQGLLQDAQVNELINKTSGGLELFGHHGAVVYKTGSGSLRKFIDAPSLSSTHQRSRGQFH
jgi:hypothetical protein